MIGGGVIRTVPQRAVLWSQADERACHVPRYSTRNLMHKVQQVGFSVARVTSVVSQLLPLMMVSCLRPRDPDKTYDPLAKLKNGD